MSRKAQQAQAAQHETPTQAPLTKALAAMPWERTPDQIVLIARADADVRLQSMVEDQRKLRERPL